MHIYPCTCEVMLLSARACAFSFDPSCATPATLLLTVQGRNVTRIVDKMLRNAFNLGYVQLTLPRACILHTVRHPLDVALSCFSQPFEGRGLPWAAQLDGDLLPCIGAHS